MPRNLVTDPITDPETTIAAERLRIFSLSRDRVLARLWELADLHPEQTRGSIAGQIKAMAMIVAIEGLIPDRRRPSAQAQPAEPPTKPKIYVSEAMRPKSQAEENSPADAGKAVETQPAVPQVPEPASPRPADDAPSPNLNSDQTSVVNPYLSSKGTNWVPDAIGPAYGADVNAAGPFRLPSRKGIFPRGR